MLQSCSSPGCTVLTFGPLCLQHEPAVESRRFPRGRPYRLKDREVSAVPQLALLFPAGKEQAVGVVLLEGAG